MTKISLLLIFCFHFSTCLFAIPQDETHSVHHISSVHHINYKDCEPRLETSIKKKPIKILFYDPTRFRVKTVDKVIDSDKTILLKSTSYSIWSMDAGDDIRFSRLLVEKDKIYKFKFWAKSKRGKVITYNLCGEKIKKEKLLIEDFWEMYHGIYYKK